LPKSLLASCCTDGKSKAGRKPVPIEVVLKGTLFVLLEGCRWRALDLPGVNWNTIFHRYREWVKSGVIAQLLETVTPELRSAIASLDSTFVKVHKAGCNPQGGQAQELMGRTKGGLNTKLHAVVDGDGVPRCLMLSGGEASDIAGAEIVRDDIPSDIKSLLCDKAYDADELRAWLASKGITSCIPGKSNRVVPIEYDKTLYKKRHIVENFFEKIKRHHRVATRYDKTAASFLGFIQLACTLLFCKY
jgi:transposase